MDESTPTETKDEVYHIKWITWKDNVVPILTQNANGPCPLISMINVLLLRGGTEEMRKCGLKGSEMVLGSRLLEYLGNAVLHSVPGDLSEDEKLNYEANVSDAIGIMPRLEYGLDVNVKFTGVRHFEYTKEVLLFDLLNISLYHGWLVDPQSEEVNVVGDLSYNALIEKVISDKAALGKHFLESTASQLTYHGLCELTSAMSDGEIAVFFRNNHFSTITKNKERLYLLVTDQGFLKENGVVWETLDSVDGDIQFVDHKFCIIQSRTPPTSPSDVPPVPLTEDQQITHDLLLAMSLQEEIQNEVQDIHRELSDLSQLSDLEIARRLQQKEDRNRSLSVQDRSPRGGFMSNVKKNCCIS
ncbi:MINDY1_2 [Lepeophtheirus salmonis]|uniref:Ubiquitin carboxyl-terminal hydrolase n=1 Tax=Lepeophtheirus salmonis TaxID=72036 RepID=A0A7R8CXD3_LEPSM|nr:MINDY1_2 [Lepeophtheirus salmonis]CAF2930289.1 MINDY1_2 [Lepeophtheirus salmonis]